ncbi:MAG: zinc ribbon domain-containing protein [Thermodesulfobacteriota bacterium]
MPIYEYECKKCGKTTEALQSFSDKPLTTCPRCKGELAKLISQSSFHLKGSGWYVTDYAGKKPKEGKEKTASSESGPKETKSEKPAT